MGFLKILIINYAYAQGLNQGYQCEFWGMKRYFETKQVKNIEHEFTFEKNKKIYLGNIFIKNGNQPSRLHDYIVIKQDDKNYTTIAKCRKI